MNSFNPDMRNLGGRKAIVNRLNNHYESLNNIKPTMNTRSSKRAVTSTFKPKQDLREVAETFKRVQNVKKSRIDHSKPATFGVSSKLSQYKMRKKNAIKDEHSLNMKHMKRRIQEIGSLNDRKKNPWDCAIHPPYMFRNTSESGLTIDGVFAIAKNTANSDVQTIRQRESYRKRTGSFDAGTVLQIKKELLESIVSQGITDYVKLEDLFFDARERYPALAAEEAISYVKRQIG